MADSAYSNFEGPTFDGSGSGSPNLRLVSSQNSQPATEALSVDLKLSLEEIVRAAASAVFQSFVSTEDLSAKDAAAALQASAAVRKALRLIEQDPVEPGEEHDAEDLLDGANSALVGSKLLEAFEQNEAARRSILLLVGRLHDVTVEDGLWADRLLRSGLADSNVRVREATVRAIESLSGNAKAILRTHHESNAFLANYIGQVLG